MDNVKIATELVRLAKELTAADDVKVGGKNFSWREIAWERFELFDAIRHEILDKIEDTLGREEDDWPTDMRNARKDVNRVLHHINRNYGGVRPAEADDGLKKLARELNMALKSLRRVMRKYE